LPISSKHPGPSLLGKRRISLSIKEDLYRFFNGTIDIPIIWQILFVFFIIGDYVLVQIIPYLSALSESFV
jgi:hypothetical protein